MLTSLPSAWRGVHASSSHTAPRAASARARPAGAGRRVEPRVRSPRFKPHIQGLDQTAPRPHPMQRPLPAARTARTRAGRPDPSTEESGSEAGQDTGSSAANGATWSPVAAGGLVAGALAVAALVQALGGPTHILTEAEGWVKGAGELGPLYFVACYTGGTLLLLPGSALTLLAGYLYGPLVGTALVSAASTSAAAAAFLISRYLARPLVEANLPARFQAIDAAVAEDGARVVFLLRLSPLVPFALSNYMYGLTSVSFPSYVAASWAGMLPGTFAYVYLGGTGREAVEAVGTGDGGLPLVKLALYGLGAAATIGATSLISKYASGVLALDEASTAGEADALPDVDDKDDSS